MPLTVLAISYLFFKKLKVGSCKQFKVSVAVFLQPVQKKTPSTFVSRHCGDKLRSANGSKRNRNLLHPTMSTFVNEKQESSNAKC